MHWWWRQLTSFVEKHRWSSLHHASPCPLLSVTLHVPLSSNFLRAKCPTLRCCSPPTTIDQIEKEEGDPYPLWGFRWFSVLPIRLRCSFLTLCHSFSMLKLIGLKFNSSTRQKLREKSRTKTSVASLWSKEHRRTKGTQVNPSRKNSLRWLCSFSDRWRWSFAEKREIDLVRSASDGMDRRCAIRRSFCKQMIRCSSQSMNFLRIVASVIRKKSPSTSNGSLIVSSSRGRKFDKSFSSRSICRLRYHTNRETKKNWLGESSDETCFGYFGSHPRYKRALQRLWTFCRWADSHSSLARTSTMVGEWHWNVSLHFVVGELFDLVKNGQKRLSDLD